MSAVVWLIIAAVFCIVESMTVALVSIWMAISAFLTAIIAFWGGNAYVQIISFLLLSAILIVATIPLSKRVLNNKKEKTNADRVIDATAVVIEQIDSIENKGKIKVMGQIWSASSLQCETIPVGQKVIIRSIEGVRAMVDKI